MRGRFTQESRKAVGDAQEYARRLGHGFIGTEHLLFGLASTDGEAGAVLRRSGVTPERVEAEFVRLIGTRNVAGGDLFDALDHDALTAIGIDLDAVRERIESAFGPHALASGAPSPRRWRRPRRDPATGHLPVTRRAKRCLERAVRDAHGEVGAEVGAEHIALALLGMDGGLHRDILSGIGASATRLRAEILTRHRRAG
ncbi:MAG: Clp protease [Actinophytocola sp.]|uniref:Clp protease N-terminal domain-containing protein n=1 Tax=Actinophytocola sp. TaxID=1872138 RepID=UPI001320D8EA|nr:Clp protease N-terminal domain-containing protein [Actinophytocola sp.]MPZ85256.1 Clp protease [Actinophytocola sp.]